ncbi:hypothetical protein BD289DRAFT_450505 [Coniella lustricola]|uniref:Uncharacterized protein n=1 Tax=Coniella lustricola TaxID=2025994 RepID=A0A2T3AIN0_9PEZI|nr:hypothetical protein BD289DRAFT_450505 [Coniella lustricola]
MLGHLRFHRRGHSNPSSPVPDQLSPFDHGDDLSPDPERERAPNRKTSKQSLNDTASPPVRSPSNGLDSGFMGGLALQNYRRAFGSARLEPSDPAAESPSTDASQSPARSKPVPPPIDTSFSSARSPPVPVNDAKPSLSSVSSPPSVTQQAPAQNHVGATGKRPPGARLTSELPILVRSQTAAETQRGKKGLPFLKNPMSGLLMRRKASQNAPDLRPLPLPQKPTESTYDPRIRGTRVHDFSAPRQRVVPTRKPTVPGAEVWTGWDKYRSGPQSHPSDLPLRTEPSKSSLTALEATPAPALESQISKPSMDEGTESIVTPSQTSVQSDKPTFPKDDPVPVRPPVPSGVADQVSSSASTKSRTISAASSVQKRNVSTRTARSHKISLSEDTTLSALPKHMKSTSSRFSFDIIGAARAEKLLEERHRQRELERKANGEPAPRDSRFDDFDEDGFDYDAAMDDGGYEEAIPGVNADFDDEYYEEDIPMVGEAIIIEEEEEDVDQDDPDNDQENFAGFVFSRSDPHSALVSPATPGMVATPRDSTGRPIGHAITTDRTPDLLSAPSPLSMEAPYTGSKDEEGHLAGLGIRGPEAPPKKTYDPTVFQERRNMLPVDDLPASNSAQEKGMYYDAGLLEELQMEADEIQPSDFDESIFDAVDTDQFGRPIPGAFAQNLALREQELKKRGSESPSRSKPSSPTVGSPAKADTQSVAAASSTAEGSKTLSPVLTTPPEELPMDTTAAAYQKALADAAHKAAATGWKSRWDDEPDSPEQLKEPDVTITSPTTDSHPSTAGLEEEHGFQGVYDDDDGFGGGFDDTYDDDLLDDAFIAEANAEALAYDSEGFYGDEFGFYSAPVTRNGSHGSSAPSSSSSVGDSQYGGYFGPSGIVGRSASGRVLREPNLTPITERSEYSNRNSMMSMVMPSATLSDLRNSMASPAFAHMAPGIDDSETFSLSGLQRLRGKTFGGSQVSLSSSREGSPRSERAPAHDRFELASPSAPWELTRPQSHLGNGSSSLPHERKNSAYSLWSNSDAASGTGSPTLTVASLALSNNSVPPPPLFSPPPPPLPQPSPSFQCPPVLEDEAEEMPIPDGPLKNGAQANKNKAASGVDAAVTAAYDYFKSAPTNPGGDASVADNTVAHASPDIHQCRVHAYHSDNDSYKFTKRRSITLVVPNFFIAIQHSVLHQQVQLQQQQSAYFCVPGCGTADVTRHHGESSSRVNSEISAAAV